MADFEGWKPDIKLLIIKLYPKDKVLQFITDSPHAATEKDP